MHFLQLSMERVYNFKAEYTKYIVEPALGESGVGGAMAVYGAFDAIVMFVGYRSTHLWSQVNHSNSLCRSFYSVIVLLWLLLKYKLGFSSIPIKFLLTVPLCSVTSGVLGILYPLLIAAALGIGDGIFNTQLNALLGKLFKHDMEGAFAQLKVWRCVSIAVVFFVSPHVSLHAVLVVMRVAVCISIVGFLFLTLMVEKAFSCGD
ncbi:hypothetical protein HYC85_006617 [Camellia sinensis]|uniref:Uncharacterized protein n=1 Tax=Camellia sinensis TaxID=4442 RepID=A0A7J7HNH1_CAMSI|nr:hypothetical protein HYC85_006617 [Camellia sinensis]